MSTQLYVNSNCPTVNPSTIYYSRPPLTGMYQIYYNYDDGWQLSAGTYNYIQPIRPLSIAKLDTSQIGILKNNTLISNNFYGNKYRFTDEFGGQTYTSKYMIDHLTGLGWDMNLRSGLTFSQCLLLSTGNTLAGFADWRLPNINEYDTLHSNQDQYTHLGVNLGNVHLRSSTIRWDGVTYSLFFNYQGYVGSLLLSNTLDSIYRVIFVRNHYN